MGQWGVGYVEAFSVFSSRGPSLDMGVDLMTTTWDRALMAGVSGLTCHIPWSWTISNGKVNDYTAPSVGGTKRRTEAHLFDHITSCRGQRA